MLGAALALAALAACGHDPVSISSSDLRHATATPACGPADGPAIAIYLANAPATSPVPPAPYVRIYALQSLDQLPGRTLRLDGDDLGISAWFFATPTQYEAATRGTLTVSAVAPDKTIEGFADLTFPKAGHIVRGFRAAWIPQLTLCG